MHLVPVALFVLLAIPDDPDAALGQLDRFGSVPECLLEEEIEKTGFNHVHHFTAPKVLPALAEQTAQLVPFLEHPNRRVVLRAVELLCHSGGADVPGRVHTLSVKFPCEEELRNAAMVLTQDDKLAAAAKSCPRDQPPVMLAPTRTLARWRGDAVAAKAISSGDTAALARTLWSLDALAPSRAQEAVATLALVDNPRAILATVRGLSRRLGQDTSSKVDPLLRGFLGAQLDALAAKLGVSRVTAYCAVVGAAAVEDHALLRMIESRFSEGDRAQLEKEAEKARQNHELTPFGRAWLEKLAKPQHDWMAGRRKLGAFVEHRDRPALRAYVKDEGNAISDRLDAAKELAILGDATGLVLWESSEGLWPEERDERRALLVRVSHDAPLDVRTKAEALLSKSW